MSRLFSRSDAPASEDSRARLIADAERRGFSVPDYIRTAVLKGLPWHVVIPKHALRNALITPFTVIMLQINWLLSGVIVVEFFFAYKGFGALLLEASLNQDIYLIEACTLVAVCVAVVTQTLADVGYTSGLSHKSSFEISI